MNKEGMETEVQNVIDMALEKFPEAKKIAVQNFVWSAPADHKANKANLTMDARLYNWNTDTVQAIRYALTMIGIY